MKPRGRGKGDGLGWGQYRWPRQLGAWENYGSGQLGECPQFAADFRRAVAPCLWKQVRDLLQRRAADLKDVARICFEDGRPLGEGLRCCSTVGL